MISFEDYMKKYPGKMSKRQKFIIKEQYFVLKKKLNKKEKEELANIQNYLDLHPGPLTKLVKKILGIK